MLILFSCKLRERGGGGGGGGGNTGDPDTAESVIASSATEHVFGVSALPTPVEPFYQKRI